MESQPFYFRGGHLALDFCNTVGNRLADDRREYLLSPTDLEAWTEVAGLKPPRKPSFTRRHLATVIRFREALFRTLRAEVEGRTPTNADVQLIDRAARQFQASRRLRRTPDGYVLSESDAPLEWLLGNIAVSAVELLTSQELAFVRMCAAEDCGWFFLDHSRSHPRKWCSMADCGNRAKARRHYERNLRV
jgi:predicted RNA-binding Zn ribbon-like protein